MVLLCTGMVKLGLSIDDGMLQRWFSILCVLYSVVDGIRVCVQMTMRSRTMTTICLTSRTRTATMRARWMRSTNSREQTSKSDPCKCQHAANANLLFSTVPSNIAAMTAIAPASPAAVVVAAAATPSAYILCSFAIISPTNAARVSSL